VVATAVLVRTVLLVATVARLLALEATALSPLSLRFLLRTHSLTMPLLAWTHLR
jgi:hypothetical protein